MKRSKRVFHDLAIKMMGFGVIIGFLFPFLLLYVGVSSSTVMTAWFFTLCILAGSVVGLVNIFLTRVTIGKKLKIVTEKMSLVKDMVLNASINGDFLNCNTDLCQITIDSDDEFGNNAKTFNDLIESITKSLKTQETLREYTEVLSSQLEIQPLANSALEILINYSNSIGGMIFFQNKDEIETIASHGLDDTYSLVFNDMIKKVFKNGEQIILNMTENQVFESVLDELKPIEVIIEPVKYMNLTIAVIVLISKSTFNIELKKQLEIFNRALSISLNNAFEHEQLQKIAALDPLTGIYNRRHGLIRFIEEYSSAVRHKRALGILMIDIDHFKKVNDTYGHLMGDKVLVNFTAKIQKIMRVGDLFIRYGGEEFLLILDGATKKDTYLVAERIRIIIKESITTYGNDNISVTVSIGCDSFPETLVSSEEELLKNADKALYRAKESGRDQVVIF